MFGSKKILIVDQDPRLLDQLSRFLPLYGHQAYVAADADSMRLQLSRYPIDLLVLDLMLPGENGPALVRDLHRTSNLPIIGLTLHADPHDLVIGLESGADDCLCKPFEARELVARIHSVLRRTTRLRAEPKMITDVIEFDGWQLHRKNHCLQGPDGQLLPLSNAEFRLLCTMLDTPRRAFRREQLLDHELSHIDGTNQRSVDLLISRLRVKLARIPSGAGIIKTVRGVGYMVDGFGAGTHRLAQLRPCGLASTMRGNQAMRCRISTAKKPKAASNVHFSVTRPQRR